MSRGIVPPLIHGILDYPLGGADRGTARIVGMTVRMAV
jgi:hypothetical protein